MKLDENMSLEDVRAFFAKDRFAYDACGLWMASGIGPTQSNTA